MPEGNYKKIDGADIYYETRGEGFPIVFLHTAGTDGRIWKSFVELLPSNIKAIVPDLPGHGKSWPWANWRKSRVDVEFYADKILKLINELKLEKLVVVGCSIGADIALMLSAMLGSRASLIVSLEGAARTSTFLEQDILKTEPGNVERAFDFCGRSASKDSIEKLIWIRSSNNRDIYVTDLLAWNNFDVSARLPGVGTKVVVARGEDDPVVTERMLEDTLTLLKNGVKSTLAGLGHYPMIESPEKLKEYLLPLLLEASRR